MEEKKTFKEIFDELNAVNVNEFTETKKIGNVELTYLSWAKAWELLIKHFPNSTYEVHEERPNRQCFYDDDLGYIVKTSVTVEGHTRSMWLPVMDNSHKNMFDHSYTYIDGKGVERTVDAATYFDINTSVMRCLVKNIAMFGLGLYIYAGEDLPSNEAEAVRKKQNEASKNAMAELAQITTPEQVKTFKEKYADVISKDINLRQAFLDKVKTVTVS